MNHPFRPLVVIALLLAFMPLHLTAQTESPGYWGVKGGLSIVEVTSTFPWLDFPLSPKSSWHAGLFKRWNIGTTWQLSTEVLYSRRGGRSALDLTNQLPDDAYRVQFDYLTIPLSWGLRFDDFTLEAGLEGGYQLQKKVSGSIVGNVELAERVWDERFDLSGLLGLRYRLKFLEAGIRFSPGLNYLSRATFTNVNGETTREGGFGRNQAWQVSLGICW